MIMIKKIQLPCMIFFVFVVLSVKATGIGTKSKEIQCIKSEREALLVFKRGLFDDYQRLSSWGSEEDKTDCCKWQGIECSNITGHVIKISLSYSSNETNPLRGKISSSLLELHNLNYLDLSANDFGGIEIPDFIGSLTKLSYLDLSYSNFSGVVPYQLGNLSKLYHLNLSFNQFDSSVPESIGSLTSLRYLVLSYANFSGAIPHQFGNLSRLQYLDLGNNNGIFSRDGNLDWLSHLSLLKYLDLSCVNLSLSNYWIDTVKKLPVLSDLILVNCELYQVMYPFLSLKNSSSSISSLNLSTNNLTSSIYTWLFNLSSSLVYLNLGRNNIKGPVPEAFSSLTSLNSLYLFENKLDGGIPITFGSLCNLQKLDLSFNSFRGNLSGLLSGCADNSLESLWLSDNQFTGSFPYDIARFSLLTDLDLSNNQLNGVLPKTIGQLSKLEFFAISRNSFEGFISEEHLLNLSSLVYLDMSFNPLAFNLSFQWIPPFHLQYLLLRSCKLGPSFPHWIQTVGNFTFLDLSNNGISASVPASFWYLADALLYLNLSSNNIIGEIPEISSTFTSSAAIDLSSNQFEGPIPRFLSHKSSLYLNQNNFSGTLAFLNSTEEGPLLYIDVSHNQISGEIPDCWQHYPSLRIINLSYNKLFGAIPSSVGHLLQLETFVLGNNHLSGEIPLSLRNSTELRFLDARRNNLSGTIPTWIGKRVSQLYVLVLNSNNFRGSIPLQLCHLKNLQLLDLSMNEISGSVPECFTNITAMVEKEFTFLFANPVNNFFSFSDGLLLPSEYVNSEYVGLKGGQYEYGVNLELLKGLDLSSNKLTGEFPEAITKLVGLISLNLSRNLFFGNIPQNISLLNSLESLDLSRNQFSGQIPMSLSELNFLSYLDLSDNNLSGRIPSGTQLQGFTVSSYEGNSRLCGLPLVAKCPGDEVLSRVPPLAVGNEEDEDGEFEKWFRIGAAFGFTTVSGIICGLLLFNDRLRNEYFLFLDMSRDRVMWMHKANLQSRSRSENEVQGLNRLPTNSNHMSPFSVSSFVSKKISTHTTSDDKKI